MKLKSCPFCFVEPDVKNHTICANFDHCGNRYPEMIELPNVRIECNNIGCATRPTLSRINWTTERTVELWNVGHVARLSKEVPND